MAEKLRSVLSLRMAIRFNSLILRKKLSVKCHHLKISAAIRRRAGAPEVPGNDDVSDARIKVGD